MTRQVVMGIPVVGAVAERCRSRIMRVTQVQRHFTGADYRAAALASKIAWVTRFDFSDVARWIAAWARLSCASGDRRTRPPVRCDRDEQRLRVGHTDVLGRVDHHASSDETRVLPCLGMRASQYTAASASELTDALDEGADDVVVAAAAVAAALASTAPSASSSVTWIGRPRAAAKATATSVLVSVAAVAAARRRMLDGVGVGARTLDLEPPSDELGDVGLVKGMETKQGRPRHQQRVDLEVRIFGGGADQHDQPLLDGAAACPVGPC